ncbi:MAG: SurA N-terminal domain-containing protein [Lentisphaeria bacterium]
MILKCFCATLVMGFSTFAQQGFSYGDSILAVVGEKVITAYEVMQASAREEARLPRDLTVQQRTEETVALRRKILTNMIDHELLYLEFQALKAKVPETVLQERMNQAIVSQAGGDRAKFEEYLYREHMTLQEFKDKLAKNLAVDMLLYDRVNRGITLSPPKIQQYYQSRAEEFNQAAKYHLEVILLKKDGRYKDRLVEVVQEIRKKLSAGETFATLAKEYSEGANAENGGDQGWLTNMNEKLLSHVQALRSGEVASEPLDLGSSLYLVRLADFLPASQGLSPEVEEQIRKILTTEEENRRYEKFLRELRLKYSFKRMDGMNGVVDDKK